MPELLTKFLYHRNFFCCKKILVPTVTARRVTDIFFCFRRNFLCKRRKFDGAVTDEIFMLQNFRLLTRGIYSAGVTDEIFLSQQITLLPKNFLVLEHSAKHSPDWSSARGLLEDLFFREKFYLLRRNLSPNIRRGGLP